MHPVTLSQYLYECECKNPNIEGISGLIEDVAVACKKISYTCSSGMLSNIFGVAGSKNVQGEVQKKIDIVSNDIFIDANRWGGHIKALVSEELDEPWIPTNAKTNDKFVLFVDPLDGSSNSDVNVSVGTIFSIYRLPDSFKKKKISPKDVLLSGVEQLAAGYSIYGPATIMVLTLGDGVHGFTLEQGIGEFIQTNDNIQVNKTTNEFAINTSNSRFWEKPVQYYVQECLSGIKGTRGKDFNMRWVASLVAETHRILMRGGVFLYPRDSKHPQQPGRLRLMYEANPIAMIIEQAGGLASTGLKRILEVKPKDLHQRVPLIFGSFDEVKYIESLHQELPAGDYDSPLFQTRGLFSSIN